MKTYKLKDILAIKTGKAPKSKNQGNIPVYSSGGIISFTDDYIVKSTSILLPRVGTLDSIFYVNNKTWVTDNMYHSKIFNNEIDPKYLYYFLKSIDFSSKHSKTSQPKMTINDYYDITLLIPDKSIQTKIRMLLDVIESKIDVNNKINDNLLKQINLIYDWWFERFNFPDENSKPFKMNGGKLVFNESINKKIPINWKVETLFENSLSTILSPGVDKFNTEKIYYETKIIQGLDIKYGEKITYLNRKSRANMQPVVNSVWFAKMKNSIKHLFITKNMHFMLNNGILSTGFCGLECNSIAFEYISSFILTPISKLKRMLFHMGQRNKRLTMEIWCI
ncbi:restriction endonuclease subunit S [Mycoplasmopsis agalactiae]|nr:restriction endonuclease subunit S [Mycoplasmopsis agalactiae]MCE6056229.1 restriction endonuclease subunit S [Mycoplasmopsis agalactiae]